MRKSGLWILAILMSGAALAQQEPSHDEAQAEATKEAAEVRKETGAERKARQDEAVAELVEEHNEQVESDLDKVVCKKERIVGSRAKKRVCRTVREIEQEKLATERALRQRNRSSTLPAASQGQSQQ